MSSGHTAGIPVDAALPAERFLKKVRRRWSGPTQPWWGFVFTLPILALLAVGGGGSSARAEEKKPVVGLVMKSLANEFFKSMEEGARKFAAQDGTFTLVPVGMNSETDIDTQISAMVPSARAESSTPRATGVSSSASTKETSRTTPAAMMRSSRSSQ